MDLHSIGMNLEDFGIFFLNKPVLGCSGTHRCTQRHSFSHSLELGS